MQSLKSLTASRLFRGNRKSKTIDIYIFSVNADSLGSFNNSFCNLKSALGGFRNTVFVKCKSDNRRTVLFDKRKNRCKALFLTVYGVQNRFAVVVAESSLNNLGLCGVNLERNITHTLNSLENTHHHLFFVNFGMTYIDIKNFRTALNLTESLSEDIVNIIFNKRLLKQLFACGVNSFADNSRTVDFNNRR